MNTETCFSCKNGLTTLTIHEGGKVTKMDITCVVCNGSTKVPLGTKAAHDKFWCKCGNPSGETTHSYTSTDIYSCNDCGAVVQTG